MDNCGKAKDGQNATENKDVKPQLKSFGAEIITIDDDNESNSDDDDDEEKDDEDSWVLIIRIVLRFLSKFHNFLLGVKIFLQKFWKIFALFSSL